MALAVEACAVSGWQAEEHVFFGTPEMIAEKVQSIPLGTGRRLFYAAVEHTGSSKVYAYEHKEDGTYDVKVADTNSADAFNQAVGKAIYANKGQSCVGEAIQSLPEFRALRFKHFADVNVTADHDFGELLPHDDAKQHAIPTGNPAARFTRAWFHILC
jgi:hypothetical protein